VQHVRVTHPFAAFVAGIGLLAALSAASPARATDLPPLRPESPPFFTTELAISLDAEGHPALSATVHVPFTDIQWIKVPPGERRAANIEISVSFEGKGGQLYGDLWQRRVAVPSHAASRSPNSSITDRRVFPLPPGKYKARIVVRDLNAELQSTAEQTMTVPDYSKIPVGFSDLELGIVDSAGTFTLVPTRRFGLEVNQLAARVSMFDRRGGDWPRKYSFRYRILDDVGEEVVVGTTAATLAHSASPLVVRPSRSDLFVGTYSFVIELAEGSSKWRVDRSFDVDESGPPRGRDFVQMLEPLAYVASNQEIEALRALKPDQQAAGWEEFWRRRDPTPDSSRNEALIEFIRRVRYAEHHFQGFGPGWRSDMGRIYIKYGPPGQTENRPPTTGSPQLEIWYYTNPTREFVFADREGFGRYVLVSPSNE
jgi:GWxTD domain-containing protein